MEDDLKWKTTSNIKSEISQQLLVGSSPNFKLRLIWPKHTFQMFQMQTTLNGRGPQMEDYLIYQKWNSLATTGRIFPKDDLKWKTTSNIKSEISQHLLVRSSTNFKLRLMWPKQTLEMFQMKTTLNRRRPQMEDTLKLKTSSNNKSEISH